MINARKLPWYTHTHTTHIADTCLGLLVSLADWQLLQHIWQISLQPKSCCKRNCKSITARRSAWRHDATATCGSDVNVSAAVTVLCRYRCRCRCRLRRRRHRIALIDCVYATQLLHSLCFGGFSFSFYVFFCLFRFLGRAILRCHMLHQVPHATHTLTHANTQHIRIRLLWQLAQDQCCASVKSTGSSGSGPKRMTWATNLKLILTPFVIAINCAAFGRIDLDYNCALRVH